MPPNQRLMGTTSATSLSCWRPTLETAQQEMFYLGGLGQEFPGEAPGDPGTRLLLDRRCKGPLKTEGCGFWKVEGQSEELTCTEHSDCARHCSYMCIVRVSIWTVCVITHVILTAAHKMGTVIAPFYR